jgi:arylsulfatase A-like enzyme
MATHLTYQLPNRWVYLALSCLSLWMAPTVARLMAATRPNILWITAEDMSANLGCYGDAQANTPNLDRLATESVRYTRAFATAPVCSPARSTLITGCYATSLGTQRLRSEFPLPDFIKGFPQYLRDRGYFTSNNVKTDYNIAREKEFIAVTWTRNGPQAHWRQRQAEQPFFSVFNLMTTHQSRANVWPWEKFETEIGQHLSPGERQTPARLTLPPYYPDTPLVRRTMARYYDCITRMDQEVGDLLLQLKEDGLADDTIVFFYSDHGMGMPRGKRLLHDSGMHVPLIIHFPKKWRHLAPVAPGETVDRLVSFVDFAPTVLSLVNLDIPSYMQGIPFLGAKAGPARKHVFGARDRVDEVFELSRSIRDERWLLIENYMPHLSWMPPERYSDNADMRRQMKKLAAGGTLNPAQMTYASPSKPVIEFYDTQQDPHQIHNLAHQTEQSARIQGLSRMLHQWQRRTSDLGCFTEPMMWRRLESHATPWDFGRRESGNEVTQGWDAARMILQPEGPTTALARVGDNLDVIRYGATLTLHAHHPTNPEARKALQDRLGDSAPSVRIEAATAILETESSAQARQVLLGALQDPQVEVRLQAMRSFELLAPETKLDKVLLKNIIKEATRREPEHPCWMFLRFSAEATLENEFSGN